MKNTFRNKKVLITGGLGFIGSNLAIKLVELGADVLIYDALIKDLGGNKFNIDKIKKDVRVIIDNLNNQKVIERAIRDRDYIFNLAGTLSHVDSMTNPLFDLNINCESQIFLLEACKKLNRQTKIIFSGTRNQYGKALYLPVDEKHMQEPTDINGINSMAAEKYHLLYSNIYGIRSVSLRLTNTFGPRHQMKHPKQGVLNWFIRVLMDKKEVNLYGDGTQIRDVNYIDDAVEALLIAAANNKTVGQIYNLGGGAITLKEFVEKVITVLGYGKYKLVKFPKERKNIEIGNYVADIKKISSDLGWKPNTTIDDGIKKTIEYYKEFKNYYW